MSVVPFPFVTVSGVPEERGRQYGVLAAERIRRSAGLYSGTLDAFGLSPERRQSLIEEFAGRIEEFDASYVEEMRGIAKGADVPFEQIVMINARTEVVAMARAETGSPDPEEQDDGCTGALIMPAKVPLVIWFMVRTGTGVLNVWKPVSCYVFATLTAPIL